MDQSKAEIRSISATCPARSTIEGSPLDPDELRRMHAYWRAIALSVGRA